MRCPSVVSITWLLKCIRHVTLSSQHVLFSLMFQIQDNDVVRIIEGSAMGEYRHVYVSEELR